MPQMQNVKYIHNRKLNQDGTITPNGGLTIAYVLGEGFKVVGWAAARCHDKDHYNKKIGRAKASGRLLSNNWFQECEPTPEKEFIQKAAEGYKESGL